MACCPVKACTAQVLTLLNDNTSLDTLICTYQTDPVAKFSYITNANILNAVQEAIKHTKVEDNGYKEKTVGSHSL